jgi:hypothetical protein
LPKLIVVGASVNGAGGRTSSVIVRTWSGSAASKPEMLDSFE